MSAWRLEYRGPPRGCRLQSQRAFFGGNPENRAQLAVSERIGLEPTVEVGLVGFIGGSLLAAGDSHPKRSSSAACAAVLRTRHFCEQALRRIKYWTHEGTARPVKKPNCLRSVGIASIIAIQTCLVSLNERVPNERPAHFDWPVPSSPDSK
jgi:hypothetical protein